jgi:hypothetical protein
MEGAKPGLSLSSPPGLKTSVSKVENVENIENAQARQTNGGT